jgi:uncharacterized protein YggE
MKRRYFCDLQLAVLAIWLVSASVSPAQVGSGPAAGEGITVSGTGSVAARPNLVEVDLQVVGKAELTGDALVKYRDAKKRVLDVLAKLEIENLDIQERAVSITVGNSTEQQQRIMNGMMQAGGKPEVSVSSTVRLTLKKAREREPEELIKTIGRLLDVAQDAGVNVGPTAAEVMMAYRYGRQPENSAPVRFVLDDLVELREKAYEAAAADAQARATRLAKLHQKKLGPALSIQELAVGGDSPTTTVVNAYIYQQNMQPSAIENEGPRIISSSLAEVPVQVKLIVRYGITTPDPATAQK